MAALNPAELVKKIQGLPPLNLVVQKLLSVVRNEASSATEVTDVLSSDQAIASKVLALVNSSFYGFPSKVTTISRAVVILGNKSVQSLALSFAAMDFFKHYKGTIPIEQFWRHALATATTSQQLAKEINYPVPEELFIAGLLHDIGQLILSLFYPQYYNPIVEEGPANFISVERKALGLGHQEVGAMLLKHWNLPPVLINAVLQHHRYDQCQKNQILAILTISEFVSALLGRPSVETIDEAAVNNSLEVLALNSDKLSTIIKASYTKTIASEASFDISSIQKKLIQVENEQRSIVITAKSHTRREILSAGVKALGYRVQAVPPKNIQQAARLNADGIVFDATGLKSVNAKVVSQFIDSNSLPGLIIEGDNEILLSSPTRYVHFPFALDAVNSLFEEE